MKHKKILLVANDNLEVLNVQRELTKHHIDHSLHIAKNGLDALALLMGCSSPQLENYTTTGKVQPDIILMDAESPGLHMIELLCIMQKYYSLQKIRVFLMVSDPEKIALSEAEKLGIAGIVTKPFSLESTLYDAKKLRNEFGTIPQKAWLPLLSIIPNIHVSKWCGMVSKFKYAVLKLAGTFGAKTAVAGAIVIGGTLVGTSLTGNAETKNTTTDQAFEMSSPSEKISITEVSLDMEENEVAQLEDKQSPSLRPNQKKSATATSLQAASPNPTSESLEKKSDRVFRIVVTEDDTQSMTVD